jgi:hypothetical protein
VGGAAANLCADQNDRNHDLAQSARPQGHTVKPAFPMGEVSEFV